MRLLIDSTIIHRIGDLLKAGTASIVPSAAEELLQFAEYILFADNILYIGSVPTDMVEKSDEVLDKLAREDCLPVTPIPLIAKWRPKIDDYAGLLREAATDFAEWGRHWLTRSRLADLGSIFSDRGFPGKVKASDFELLIEASINDQRQLGSPEAELRREDVFTSLRYALRTPVLRDALLAAIRDGGRFDSEDAVAIIGALRIAINYALAKGCEAFYSPAPERIRADEAIEHWVRDDIDRLLPQGRAFATPLFISVEAAVPLPELAMRFLAGANPGGPRAVLRAACEHREDPSIADVRNQLRAWQCANLGLDSEALLSAENQLEAVMRNLGFEKNTKVPISILRRALALRGHAFGGANGTGSNRSDLMAQIAHHYPQLKARGGFIAVTARHPAQSEVGAWYLRTCRQ